MPIYLAHGAISVQKSTCKFHLSQNARESHRNNVIPQLWASADLCDITYQRRSVPFSPHLLSTYCISELLRIYLAPPVFDNSANNGGMQRHVCL